MNSYAENKKARFDHDILETVEAGVVLSGHEVKAIRAGKARLKGGRVIIRGGEAFLVGAAISPYQPSNLPKNYDPERARKLLLSRKEIDRLEQASERSGLTLIPLKWYNSRRGRLKLGLALARGKKKADKRQTLKKRDSQRAIQRILKNQ